MSDAIKEWFEQQPNVVSADVQVVYFPAAWSIRSPRTVWIIIVNYSDDVPDYFISPECCGGDFRNDAVRSEMILESIKPIYAARL